MKTSFRLIAASLVVASCTGSFLESRSELVDVDGDLSHDMIVLGEKLDDPYTVENMTKAVESLYPTKAGRTYLEPTGYYVRFLPADDDELESLYDSGLVLVDHPVDYEILRDGDYYQDPEVGGDRITWQYCLVEKDFAFPPGIRYEILDDCYIPEDDPATKADGIDWEQVERTSYMLTGNEGRLCSATRASSSGKPAGRISIVDSDYDDEPFGVKGVRVMCNSFVKFSTAYTDDEGYYEMKRKFSSDVRYRLVFRNTRGFSIGLNKILIPASTSALGKHGPEGTSITVTSGSERKLFTRCVVNNAAYDWWNSCSDYSPHIKTPPSNLRIWIFNNIASSSAVMLQQGCLVDDGLVGDLLGEVAWLVKMFLPDITLGLKSCDDYASIHTLTVHECAHASHFVQAGKEWWSALSEFILKSFVTSGWQMYGTGQEDGHEYCEIAEMWAYMCQTMMFRERYEGAANVFGTNYWFFPQILLYLEERGLTRYKIYPALVPEVTSRDELQAKLLNLYPDYKSIIKQAFDRYE